MNEKLTSALMYCWLELVFKPNAHPVELQIYDNCEAIVGLAEVAK